MEPAAWLDITNSDPRSSSDVRSPLPGIPTCAPLGSVLVAASLAMDYGFTDIDGKLLAL